MKNRVQIDGSLERHVPQKNIEDLEMAEIQERLKESLVPLVLRVITKYCPAYKEFSVAVEHHLHHQYSAAMARKSEQVLIQCMWVVLFRHLSPQSPSTFYRYLYFAPLSTI